MEPTLSRRQVERLPLPELPEYPIGSTVVISRNGVYEEVEVIKPEVFWSEKKTRVKLPDGRKLTISRKQIVQLKQE
jgi:hypothetical protein